VMAFKDAQSHFAYLELFSQQQLVWVLMSHLQSSSRVLGVFKAFCPDAERNFYLVQDRIYKRAVTCGKRKKEIEDEAKLFARMFKSMA
ncbi:hypothetical protein ACNIRO_25270, partial [Escherichia coli]